MYYFRKNFYIKLHMEDIRVLQIGNLDALNELYFNTL